MFGGLKPGGLIFAQHTPLFIFLLSLVLTLVGESIVRIHRYIYSIHERIRRCLYPYVWLGSVDNMYVYMPVCRIIHNSKHESVRKQSDMYLIIKTRYKETLGSLGNAVVSGYNENKFVITRHTSHDVQRICDLPFFHLKLPIHDKNPPT